MAQSNTDGFSSLQTRVNDLQAGVNILSLGPDVQDLFCDIASAPSQTIGEMRILQGLAYDAINGRMDQVDEAHLKTFRWILGDPDPDQQGHPGFIDWLRNGTGIFHVAGKLGSGKSTLMKFLYKHHRTAKLLEWAGNQQLITAQFFFWRAGSPEQKSLGGLIRSILHDILKQCPTLIPTVLPHQWESTMLLDGRAQPCIHFSREDLRTAFDFLIHSHQLYEKHRLCFFIDGLDEYEETCQEDYDDMINMLHCWVNAAPSDVKLCVSSREYEVFQGAFCDEKRLRLQDLTRNDMKSFVWGRLDGLEIIERGKPQHDCKVKLVDQLVIRADGIFLWVALVLKDLRKAMKHDNELSSLLERVESMPQEMEPLFSHLLDSINEFDRRSAYRILAMISRLKIHPVGNYVVLSLLSYSFLPQYEKNPKFAMAESFGDLPLGTVQVESRKARARARLNDQLNGLVQIAEKSDRKDREHLQLAHRSAHEFISTNYHATIAEYCIGFDIEDAISQTYLAGLKLVGPLVDISINELRFILSIRKDRDMDASPYRFHNQLNDSVLRVQGIDPTKRLPQPPQLNLVLDVPTIRKGYISIFHLAATGLDMDNVCYQVSENPNFSRDPFQLGQLLSCVLYPVLLRNGSLPSLQWMVPLMEGGIELGSHWETGFVREAQWNNVWNLAIKVAAFSYAYLVNLGERSDFTEPHDKQLFGTLLEKLLMSEAYKNPRQRRPIFWEYARTTILKEGVIYLRNPRSEGPEEFSLWFRCLGPL